MFRKTNSHYAYLSCPTRDGSFRLADIFRQLFANEAQTPALFFWKIHRQFFVRSKARSKRAKRTNPSFHKHSFHAPAARFSSRFPERSRRSENMVAHQNKE